MTLTPSPPPGSPSPSPPDPPPSSDGSRTPRRGPRLRGRERQRDRERRAASFAVACRGDAAAVELDDVLDDGQSEPEAAVRARRAAVALAEALEDQRKELAGDALAGVGHGDAHGVALELVGADGDRAARRRELDRVREQIPDHLLQALGVAGGNAVDAREVEVQRNS